MDSTALTPEAYIASISEERRVPFEKLRKSIKSNLPKGYKETITHGMISFVVPHSIYAPGYHVNPSSPLPFVSIASQKNFIALYHMGLYANETLLQWFRTAYEKSGVGKLDMGKSCIRFKNPQKIPFDLLADLASKMEVQEWIALYEQSKPTK